MKNVFRTTLLWLISKRFFLLFRLYAPSVVSSPVYKPSKNPLRSCISQGLISGSLRYLSLEKGTHVARNLFYI